MPLKRLRELRKEQNRTQQQVAELLHINRRTYSAYENGYISPPLHILCGLADLYHTSVDYLVGFTDQRTFHQRK